MNTEPREASNTGAEQGVLGAAGSPIAQAGQQVLWTQVSREDSWSEDCQTLLDSKIPWHVLGQGDCT